MDHVKMINSSILHENISICLKIVTIQMNAE